MYLRVLQFPYVSKEVLDRGRPGSYPDVVSIIDVFVPSLFLERGTSTRSHEINIIVFLHLPLLPLLLSTLTPPSSVVYVSSVITVHDEIRSPIG